MDATPFHDSAESSGLSSPLSSAPSSPLSSPASSPEPPPGMGFPLLPASQLEHDDASYPSPPASQQTSHNGSPTPDCINVAMPADKDGPPPAKRRRISRDPKERTTEYLDLRSGQVVPEQQEELDRMMAALHKRQKIVVIAGAGMSVSAGIPDFRSADGLFKSLKEEHKIKGSGKDLFDASVYKDDTSTLLFHNMVTSLSRSTKDAKPTAFHHMLATIANEGRLLRLYSQNVDALDTGLEPLQTRIPFAKAEDGKWPRTVQLHGSLEKMVCSKCHELFDFDVELFEAAGALPPACPSCETVNDIRTNNLGKRSHGVGRLRPRMVLYNEQHPDAEAIGSVTQHDLKRRPDAVIVVGTTLKVPGVQRIVQEMCATVRDRKDGGLAIWINQDTPPTFKQFHNCFDIIVQSDCDEVAKRAAMGKWYETSAPEDFSEVSEEDAQRAAAKRATVHLSPAPSELEAKCQLTQANLEKLPSEAHRNNSFRPPPPDATPKQDPDSARPENWSPLSSRKSSIMPSIELDGTFDDDSITVANGLLTPSKSNKSSSQRSTPASKLPSLNDKLKDASKGKKPGAATGRKNAVKAAPKPPKKTNVKFVKPATSKAKKTASKTPAQPVPKTNSLTKTFTTTKTSSVAAKDTAAKVYPSPPNGASKLRQVSNVSDTLHPVPTKDARVNTSPSKNISPSKKVPFFPNLNANPPKAMNPGVKRKISSS